MKRMTKNKKKVLIFLLSPFVIFSAYLLYEKNMLPLVHRDLPHCLKFVDGTASVEVRYPDNFNSSSYVFELRIDSNESPDSNILQINEFSPLIDTTDSADIINSIVNADTKMGPIYTRAVLNGLPVALANNRNGTKSQDIFYQIPLGNKILALKYDASSLSVEERKMAEKMLSSIKFSERAEDYKGAHVENCKTWGNFFFN